MNLLRVWSLRRSHAYGDPLCIPAEDMLFKLKSCQFCPHCVCPNLGMVIKKKTIKLLLIAICLAQEIVSKHPHRLSPAATLEPDWSLGNKNRCFTYYKYSQTDGMFRIKKNTPYLLILVAIILVFLNNPQLSVECYLWEKTAKKKGNKLLFTANNKIQKIRYKAEPMQSSEILFIVVNIYILLSHVLAKVF